MPISGSFLIDSFTFESAIVGAFNKEIENELSPNIVNIDVDTLISKL